MRRTTSTRTDPLRALKGREPERRPSTFTVIDAGTGDLLSRHRDRESAVAMWGAEVGTGEVVIREIDLRDAADEA